jgi:hypothetical protein
MNWKTTALAFLLPAIVGCSLATPGFDTRLPHEASNFLGWDAEGNLIIRDKTTHDGEQTVAGGEIYLNADGTIDTERSKLEYYFHRKSRPETVGESYQHLSDNNAVVAGIIAQVVVTVTPQIVQMVLQMQQMKLDAAALKAEAGKTEEPAGPALAPASFPSFTFPPG